MLKSVEPLVLLQNAGVERGGRWLVRGIDLVVRAGEIITLVGPNGSGKSTTAKLALGIEQSSEGHVTRRAGLKVSYVPQKVVIDWAVPLRVEGMMTLTQNLSRAEIMAALATTGSDHLIAREVRHLSGGEFQRVMLARALARKPDLLVLDEPAQGVDVNGEAALYELIAQIRDDSNCGVLLISHDLHLVMAATDRVVCLNGHVCCQGTPQAVAANPAYRDLFGDRAARGLALYQHHHDHTHLGNGLVQHHDGTTTDNCHPGDGHHRGPSHERRYNLKGHDDA